MTDPLAANGRLKQGIAGGEVVTGTFVKTPHPAMFEVMATAGFDFLVLDAEHAPFDRTSMDVCILGALAWDCPVIVRLPLADAAWVGAALDCGAAGVMVPRVETAVDAGRIARLVAYDRDRGFSPSSRAAGYGARGIAAHRRQAPHETLLICQIESEAGVEAASDIAAVDGVDALFVGPVDLAVSLGLDDPAVPEVRDRCEAVLSLAGERGRTGLFVASRAAAQAWQAQGATLFVVGSDQALVKAGARAALQT